MSFDPDAYLRANGELTISTSAPVQEPSPEQLQQFGVDPNLKPAHPLQTAPHSFGTGTPDQTQQASGDQPVPVEQPPVQSSGFDPDAYLAAQDSPDDDAKVRDFVAWRAANSSRSPDEQAKVLRYATSTGLSPQFFDGFDLKKLEADPTQLREQLARYPKTAKYMEQVGRGELAKDDVENMGAIEKYLGPLFASFSNEGNHLEAITRENLKLELDKAGLHWLNTGIQNDQRIRQLTEQGERSTQDRDPNAGFLMKRLWDLERSTPFMLENVATEIAGGWLGATVAGLAAAETGPGAVPAAAGGAAIGAPLLTGLFNYGSARGEAYWQLSQMRDEQGKPIDPAVARMAAEAIGRANGVLMSIPFAGALKNLPFVKPFVERETLAAASRATQVLTKSVIAKQAFKGFAKHEATAFATMATLGATNQAVQEAAKGYSNSVDGTHFEVDPLEVPKVAMTEGLKAIATFAPLSAIEPVHGMIGDFAQLHAARESQQRLAQLTEATSKSKLLQRMPEEFEKAIKQLKDDSPDAVSTVYVPVAQFQRLAQEQGLDPETYAGMINNDQGAAYREANLAGEGAPGLAIPIENYLTRVVGAGRGKAFADDVKLDQNGLTPRQAKERAQFLADKARILGETYEPGKDASADEVYRDFYDRSLAASRASMSPGDARETAHRNAQIVARVFGGWSKAFADDELKTAQAKQEAYDQQAKGSGLEGDAAAEKFGTRPELPTPEELAQKHDAFDFYKKHADKLRIFDRNGVGLEGAPERKGAPAQDLPDFLNDSLDEQKDAQKQADTAKEQLQERFDRENKNAPERARALFIDKNTGLYNEEGFRHLAPPKERRFLAEWDVEGFKPTNDVKGHEAGDATLRLRAQALRRAGIVDGAKLGNTVKAWVESPEQAQRIAEQMQTAAGGKVRVTAGVAERVEAKDDSAKARQNALEETFTAAADAHRKVKDDLVAKGELAHRQSPALAFLPKKDLPKIDLDQKAKAAGLDPKSKEAIEKFGLPLDSEEVKALHKKAMGTRAAKDFLTRSQRSKPVGETPITEAHQDVYMGHEERGSLFDAIHYRPDGTLTKAGFDLAVKEFKPKQFVSADARGIASMNKAFGKEGTNQILEEFRRALRVSGGDHFFIANPHGDEFFAFGKHAEVLDAYFGSVKEHAEKLVFVKRLKGGRFVIQEGVHFAHGIADSLKKADEHELAEAKRKQGDVPGPETLSAAEAERRIADHIAAGRRVLDVGLPLETARAGEGVLDSRGLRPHGEGHHEVVREEAGGSGGPDAGVEGDPRRPDAAPGVTDEEILAAKAAEDTRRFRARTVNPPTADELAAGYKYIESLTTPERRKAALAWLNYAKNYDEDPSRSALPKPEVPKDIVDGLMRTGVVDPQWKPPVGPIGSYFRRGKVKGQEPAELRKQRLLDATTRAEGVDAAMALPYRALDQGPVHPDVETPRFKKWFGKSKVIDSEGKPLVVYHGSNYSGFDRFDKEVQDPTALFGPGFYFTQDPDIASSYTDKSAQLIEQKGEAPGVYPVYLSIKNPFDATGDAKNLVSKLMKFAPKEIPPFDIKRMIDSALRDEPDATSAEGIGAWVDNTEWAYNIADKAGKNGEELIAPYFDYVLSKARDHIVKMIRSGDLSTGEEVLEHIQRHIFNKLQNDNRNTREVLERLGFDGITHIGGNRIGDGREHQVWIAFNPEQVKSAVGNDGTFDKNDPSILSAGGTFSFDPNAKRGEIIFEPAGGGTARQFDIHLLAADKSTLAHETFHFLAEVMGDIAQQENAPAHLRDDYQKFLKWMGHDSHADRLASGKELAELNNRTDLTDKEKDRKRHLAAKEERAAYAWEQYLYEGKAPSEDLAGTFGRFAKWLGGIYKSIKNLGASFKAKYGEDIGLTDETRGVFDRLLASQEEIEKAHAREGAAGSPFKAAIEGLTPEEKAALLVEQDKERFTAEDELFRAASEGNPEEMRAHVETQRKLIRGEVERELDGDPGQRALAFFRTGRLPGQEGRVPFLTDENGQPLKLDKGDVIARFGEDIADALPKEAFAKKGEPSASVDELAQHFDARNPDGTSMSPQDFVQSIRAAGQSDREALVTSETRTRFADRFPNIIDPERRQEFAERAIEASHNEPGMARRVLELRGMFRKLFPDTDPHNRVLTAEAAQRIAEQTVSAKKVGELLRGDQGAAGYYLRAERESRKRAFEAAESGNLHKAYGELETALLNYALYREASKMRRTLERGLKTLKGSGKETWRAALGTASPAYRDGHDAILGAIGLGAKTGGLSSVSDLLKQIDDDGGLVAFDEEEIRRLVANPTPWKELGADAALNVMLAVRNIRYLANVENEIDLLGKKQQLTDFYAELVKKNEGKKPIAPENYDQNKEPTAKEKLLALGRGWDAMLKDTETLAEQLDGGDREGPAHRLLVDARLAARDKEAELSKKVLEPIRKAWKEIPKEMQKRRDEVVKLDLPIPPGMDAEYKDGFTRKFLWSLFLNAGNEGNRQRLRDGNRWSDSQIDRALQQLSPEEAKFLQTVLNVTDGLFPELAKVYEARTGLPLEKVKASSIRVGNETFQGGYFPIKYDIRGSETGNKVAKDEEAKTIAQLLPSNFATPVVGSGHTKSRVEKVKAPVRLDFDVAPAHLAAVIHDIAYGDWVRQVGRVLLRRTEPEKLADGSEVKVNPWVRVTKNVLGAERAATFIPWVQDIASARADAVNVSSKGPIDKLGGIARSRVFRGLMELNAPSWARHLLDPLMAAGEGIDKRRLLWAYLQVSGGMLGKDARAAARAGYEQSPELRFRAASFEDNIRKTFGDISGKNVETWSARVDTHVRHSLDTFVSRVVWTAANEQALAGGKSADLALRFADDAVRKSIPSGDIGEKAALLRKRTGLGSVLMLYGYMSKLYNVNARAWNRGVADGLGTTVLSMLVGGAASVLAGRTIWGAASATENILDWALTESSGLLPFISTWVKNVKEGKPLEAPQSPELKGVTDSVNRFTRSVKDVKSSDGFDRFWDVLEAYAAIAPAKYGGGAVGAVHRIGSGAKAIHHGQVHGFFGDAGALYHGYPKR